MTTEVDMIVAGLAKTVLLVPAFVNGQGPFQFALDTGASLTVLSRELTDRLGISPGQSRTGMGAGGAVAVSLAQGVSLAIGGATVADAQVAIADLSAVSQVAGAAVHGILGCNFLRSFRVTLDFRAGKLLLE